MGTTNVSLPSKYLEFSWESRLLSQQNYNVWLSVVFVEIGWEHLTYLQDASCVPKQHVGINLKQTNKKADLELAK